MATDTIQEKPVKIPAKLQKRIPDFYLFKLLRKSNYVFEGQPVHGGPFTIPGEGNILWAYHDAVGDGEEKPYSLDEIAPADHNNFQVRRTRYVPNIQAIFVDEQKGIKEREDGQRHTLLDNSQIREKLTFSRGEIRIKSTEKNLYNFLLCNPQISNRHVNSRSLVNRDPIFELVDFGYQDKVKVEKGQRREKAYELALTCRDSDMIPHCKYLGIVLKDPSGIERDMEAIKIDYKEVALTNPDLFLSSFNDPKVKTLFYIKTLSESGDLTFDKGSAFWAKTKAFICQCPVDRDPFEFLADFSLTEEGATFANNIRGVYADYKAKNKDNSSLI